MKNRVLISSISRKVSLVKSFQDAGWYVIGNDLDNNAVGLRFCDSRMVLDKVDLWIPTRDGELIRAYEYNGWPTKAIDICTDKFKFYKFCKGIGIKTPEVYFVKPRISSSGKEVECVWQELIEGQELSVDLFADFKSNLISVVPRTRIKVINGESCVTQTVTLEPFILKDVRKLVSTLRLVGHNCLQCFVKDGEAIWTDINLRFGGASAVAIKAGCLSPRWLMLLVNGKKISSEIGKHKVGLTGYSYTEWRCE